MLISGDVVDLDLGLPTGSEAGFPRPAVIVTAQEILDRSPSVIQVVPLTSTIRGFRPQITIEPAPRLHRTLPTGAFGIVGANSRVTWHRWVG